MSVSAHVSSVLAHGASTWRLNARLISTSSRLMTVAVLTCIILCSDTISILSCTCVSVSAIFYLLYGLDCPTQSPIELFCVVRYESVSYVIEKSILAELPKMAAAAIVVPAETLELTEKLVALSATYVVGVITLTAKLAK